MLAPIGHRNRDVMSNHQELLARLGRRALLAAPCFGAGFLLLARADDNVAKGLAFGLLGCAGLLLGAILLAPPLARLFAESTGGLFYPDQSFDRPQPMYSIPQARRVQGQYEEALAGFEQIAQEHPDRVEPYVAMIEIAIVNLHDGGRAEAFYQRGLAALQREEDKESLARVYRANRTRLKIGPGPGA